MSEIDIRTDRVEYEGGHAVFGAVYLKVDTPTGGHGVELGIVGREQYTYHDIRGCLPVLGKRDIVLNREKNFIDCQHILYKTKGPIALGQYVIPFKTVLPQSLPGSLFRRSSNGPKWEATITYVVWARVIGAEQVKATRKLSIVPWGSSQIHENSTPPVQVSQSVKARKLLQLIRATFNIEAWLDRSVYRVRDTVKLSLRCQSKCLGSNSISRITLVLSRHLKFLLASPDGAAASMTTETILEPEGGPVVEWSASLHNSNDVKLNKGVQTVFVPLHKDMNGGTIPPSTQGRYIQCNHMIGITVHLQAGDMVTLTIPIPHVKPALYTEHMAEGEELQWVFSCTQLHSDGAIYWQQPKVSHPDWKIWQTFPSLGQPP